MTQPLPRPGVRLARRALRDEVFDAVMERIAAGDLAPGQALGIDALAAELGVSPTPVREALAHLESTGLVHRTALRGYRVAPPLSPEAMEELFEARRVVEVAAARAAVARAADLLPVLRERHEQHLAQSAHLTAAGTPAPTTVLSAYLQADRGFHEAILEFCGNRFLLQVAQTISTHGHRLRVFVDTQHLDAEQAVTEHAAILAAFEAGDAEQVAQRMGSHIDAVRARVRQGVEGS